MALKRRKFRGQIQPFSHIENKNTYLGGSKIQNSELSARTPWYPFSLSEGGGGYVSCVQYVIVIQYYFLDRLALCQNCKSQGFSVDPLK